MWARRDPIFWTATGLFVLAVILAATVNQGYLLLGVAAYLLRPTVHAAGLAMHLVDERQLHIQYRASSVAFTVLCLGNVALILHLMGRNDHTWEKVVAVLLGALCVRALSGLVMIGDLAVAGARILMAVGAFVALFGALEAGGGDVSGIPAHVLPGAIVVGAGWWGRRSPKAIGVAAILGGLAVGTMILLAGARGEGSDLWGRTAVLALLSLPLIVAGACLLRGAARPAEEVVHD